MPDLPFSVDRTIGAAFLGNIAAGVFYGITSLQTYMYYKKNFQDLPSFKALIFMLWILDGLHLAMTTHGMYWYLVTNFMNPSAVEVPAWSLLVQVYVTCLSDFIVRCIFTRRVWLLSNCSKLLVAVIGVASLYVIGSGIAFASRGFLAGSFLLLLRDSWLLYSALGSAVFADVFIAATLCFFLSTRRTGFKSTDNLVNTMMVYSINTGLLTSVCAMACFITYAIWPQDFVFIGIYFTLSKLYLNSLLATLNARTLMREHDHGISTNPEGVSFKFVPPMDCTAVIDSARSRVSSTVESPIPL